MRGPFGKYYNDLILDPLRGWGINCTLHPQPNYGNYNNGTGLKGALMKNETDLLIVPVLSNEIPEAKYSMPIYVENLAQACVYKYQAVTEPADLLDTYLCFHWSYYISLLISFLFLIISWDFCSKIGSRIDESIRSELRRTRKPGYWLTVCAILDQDQYPNIGRISFSAISIFSTMLFYFLIDCFILNLMSTDLTIIVEPRVVRSYSDILDRDDVKVVFVESNDDNKFFSEAKVGTLEREIWDKRRDIWNAISSDAIVVYRPGFLNQTYISIIRDWVIYVAANTIMPTVYDNAKYRLFVKPIGLSYDNSYMMRKDFDPRGDTYINRAFVTLAERGLAVFLFKKLIPKGVEIEGMNTIGSLWTEKYASPNIDVPDMPLPEVKAFNLRKLIFLYIILVLFSLTILLYEMYHNRHINRYIARTETVTEKPARRKRIGMTL